MKNAGPTLKIATTYAGAIIGAGFASGQELVQFFVKYNEYGLLGILFAGLALSLLGIVVINIVTEEGIKDYRQLFLFVLGRKLGWLLQISVTFMLFVGLSIMIAGCGSIFKEQFSLPLYVGEAVSLIIIWAAILKGEKGLLDFNFIFVPILVFITLVISILIAVKGLLNGVLVAAYNPLIGGSWVRASALYVAYNFVLGSVVLSSLTLRKKEEHKIKLGCLLGGLLLGLTGFIMVAVLLINRNLIIDKEIPMLFLAANINKLTLILYGIVLWLAMLTTAVANAYCLMKKTTEYFNISHRAAVSIILVLTLPVATLGFQGLVACFYPLFGYIGLLMIAGLIVYKIKRAGT